MRRHLILNCEGDLPIFPFDSPMCDFNVESSEFIKERLIWNRVSLQWHCLYILSLSYFTLLVTELIPFRHSHLKKFDYYDNPVVWSCHYKLALQVSKKRVISSWRLQTLAWDKSSIQEIPSLMSTKTSNFKLLFILFCKGLRSTWFGETVTTHMTFFSLRM